MAHKKAGGSTSNGRDSKFHAGENVGIGKDHTLFATAEGRVEFIVKGPLNRKFVSIVTA